MKSYEDLLKDLYERRDNYLAAQKKKRKRMVKIAGAGSAFVAACVAGIFIWHKNQPAVTKTIPATESTEMISVAENKNENDTVTPTLTETEDPVIPDEENISDSEKNIGDGSEKESESDEIVYTPLDEQILGDTQMFDLITAMKNAWNPFVVAEYTGEFEVQTVELKASECGIDDIFDREKYGFKLDSVVLNPKNENISEKFTLCVGPLYTEIFPKIEKGEKILMSVRSAKNGTAGYGKDEYIWNLQYMFRLKDDGTLISVYEKDADYNGLTVDELMALVNK